MLRIVALATCLVMNCIANPILEQNKKTHDQEDTSELASVAYAVDLSVLASTATYQCMKQSLYNVAFIRGYTGAYQGQIDPYSVMNIQNAAAAGLGTEVYMTPQPISSKTGAQQFDEMYNMLIGANIYVKSIWVQVTSPNNWSTSSSTNVNFLNSILAEALQYGLNIGIYTNSDEWKQIVGGATTRNVNLWYWKTKGSGASNESPANFNDFKSFGSWTKPTVNQFAQVESICGVIVNRDVYSTSSSMAASVNSQEKSDRIVVGGLGHRFAEKPEIVL
uniref:C-type lectin domain-containing protein n=1 Tax=Haemonchus contortus TaxID=6289 RepID=A0A7I4Y1Z9_HAECO